MNLRRIDLIIIAVLVAVTAGLYAQTLHFDFINYDDNDYVFDNTHVTTGLNLENLKWAFTTGHAANWHPVTWISHQLDVEIFGPKNAGAHHATSVLLHIINVCLLYLLVRRFTCQWLLAGIVASAFAWHPLRVESVAWVSERKDVLASFFWLAATHAYVSYVHHRTVGRYSVVAVLLTLGLMSKPMLVTFPFALLLLDFWPLRRFASTVRTIAIEKPGFPKFLLQIPVAPKVRKIILEKLPLIFLVVVSSIITVIVQQAGRAVATQSGIPTALRLENAAVAVIVYLRQFVLPVKLSFFYPHPGFFTNGSIESWKWASSIVAIVLISAFATTQIRKRPYLFVGWFFFLGTLIPVIGIIQVGSQSMADRYTYIPMIGIALIVGCAISELFQYSPQLRPVIGAILPVMLLPFVAMTYHRIGFWQNSEKLMSNAIQTDDRNYIAHNNLAIVLDEKGDKESAEYHYKRAIELNDRFPHAEFNLANLYAARNENKLAFQHFKRAIQADPAFEGAYLSYGNLLAKSDRPTAAADAILVYQQGVKHCPESALLKHNLAQSYAEKGELKDAIDLWRQAMVLDPKYAKTPYLLGMALTMGGDLREGIRLLYRAIELDPTNPDAMSKLAWILATHPSDQIRKPDEAIRLAAKANELSQGENTTDLDALAAAQAAAGHFDAAQATIKRAIVLAEASKNTDLLVQLKDRESLYQSGKPFISGSK